MVSRNQIPADAGLIAFRQLPRIGGTSTKSGGQAWWTFRTIVQAIMILCIGGCVASCNFCFAEEAADAQHDATKNDQADREFALEVLPLLRARCFGCHGEDAEEIKGELDMTTRTALLAGGESGDPGVVPGKPEDSLVMEAVLWEGLEMPPKETDRLTAGEVEKIRRWIRHGARWPDADAQARYREEARRIYETEEGVLVESSGGTSDEWTYRRYQKEDLWAWQPVPSEAEVLHGELQGNPIDYFINARLAEAGHKAAPQAKPRELIRRATFDLIGLPPTPEELGSFLAAWKKDSKQAWIDLINRLLASPHYGEHWAKHWLDVSRYADTGGMSNDYERSNLWRYRDYVVRTFNEDRPYDQFVIEQLAGDELADQSVRRRHRGDESKVLQAQLEGDYTAEEAEWIVATGFLRLGPWDNAMVAEDSEARQIFLDDLVNVTGQTFLATTHAMLSSATTTSSTRFRPATTTASTPRFGTTQMAERKAPLLAKRKSCGFR